MLLNGFFKTNRSLIINPYWKDARPTHKEVFMAILSQCVFEETNYSIGKNTIKLLPGQVCASIRQIQGWCGKWITKNDVEGGIKYWSDTNVNFLRQEIRHGKSIITITYSEVYNLMLNESQTESQTKNLKKSDAKSDTNEEYKNIYKEKKQKKFSADAEKLVVEFFEYLNLKNPEHVDQRKPTNADLSAMEMLIKLHGIEKVREVFKFGIDDEFWGQHLFTPFYLRLKFVKLDKKMNTSTKPQVSNRDKVIARFKHGEFYNGAECYLNGETIAFQRGITHLQVRFNDHGFMEQFDNMLRKFQINE